MAARRVRTPGVPNARKLPLGGFTLVITATDAARQTSAAKRLSFTIVKALTGVAASAAGLVAHARAELSRLR